MLKKIDFKTAKKSFPLTVQNAKMESIPLQVVKKPIQTIGYQNENTNEQQFYKPISKILQF